MKQRYTVTFLYIDCLAGSEKLIWNEVVRRLESYPAVTVIPLYGGIIRENGDIYLVCAVRDTERFDDFVIDEIRSIRWVTETSVMFSFNSKLRPETVETVVQAATQGEKKVAVNVHLDVEPGKEREVFQHLCQLEDTDQVKAWGAFIVLHSVSVDMVLSLMGESGNEIYAYISERVRTIDGVWNSTALFGSGVFTTFTSAETLREIAKALA